MPSNLKGWVIAGAGLVVGAALAQLALRLVGQTAGTIGK